MGSITPYNTAAGRRYRVRWRAPDHAQKEKRGLRTKHAAEIYLATVQTKIATGEYIDPALSRATVGERQESWLKARKAAMKPSAYRPLEITWRLHVAPRWETVRLTDVAYSDVQDWLTALAEKRSATVTLRAYGVLAGILDVAVRDRRLPSNPARGVVLPRKNKKRHVYLSHKEVEALAIESRSHGTLVRLLAYTGLRWGEAVALRVDSVDVERRRLQVDENAVMVGGDLVVGTPKSHKRRSVPFPEFLVRPLEELCAGKPSRALVFGDGFTHQRRPDQRKGWFVYAKRRSGVPEDLTIHDLRHTAASLAIASGANVKAVQRMLGHASAAMTLDVYADLFDDDLDSVSLALHDARARSL
ncbi:tyrosine-type recombinase/integrase [Leifsonia sp. NPDC058230]|uniref:tyrosine-type recombinase/integrase n=1 Tax=Leifsonia sp. NPDC058230 TaxID=3346391 RepID=UPI0036DE0839